MSKIKWLATVTIACLLFLSACEKRYHIKGDMYFTNLNVTYLVNIYYGDVPVIPGGIDSAFWDDKQIVAKGDSLRYAAYSEYKNKPAGMEYYFIIDPDKYQADPAQRSSAGFAGPYSKQQIEQLHPGILKGRNFTGL